MAPTLVSLNPAPNSSQIALSSNIILSFNENVKLGSTGVIKLYKSVNAVSTEVETWDIAQVVLLKGGATLSGKKLTIDPRTNFLNDTNYIVVISGGAIKDNAGNDFAGLELDGIGPKSPLKFKTVPPPPPPPDTIVPILNSSSPANNAVDVALNTSIVLNFSENIKKSTDATKKIELYKKVGTTTTLVETLKLVTSNSVTINDSKLIVQPTKALEKSTN